MANDVETLQDGDPQETREWLEALASVLDREGTGRAHFLIEQLIDQARRSGAYLPYSPNTAYVNTIPVNQEPQYPGDRAIEKRIEAYIRWNAMAMVVHANKENCGIGGHIATYASAGTLYEVGFNHFWRAPSKDHGGDHGLYPGPFFARHLRALLSGRPLQQRTVAQFPPRSGA